MEYEKKLIACGKIFFLQPLFLVFILIGMCGAPFTLLAAPPPPNTITFDNQSGQNALVKLIGPTTVATRIPFGQKKTVHAKEGEYYILVQYGNSPKEYTFTKGEPFMVTQPGDQHSIITITLHRIIEGYDLPGQISEEEFSRAKIAAGR